MSRVRIALFTKDRLPHLRLCLDWLLRSDDISDCSICVYAYDDRSKPEVLSFLKSRSIRIIPAIDSYDTPQERLGDNRRRAFNDFLHNDDDDYLLLLDSDILLTKHTIADAIRDYEYLLSLGERVGGYTLYAFPEHITGQFEMRKQIFATADLTGDGHMLFRRDNAKYIGNWFGACLGGFADRQIQAICKGHGYWTRITPAYRVQHLGIGSGGSLCYPVGPSPTWVLRPYRDHITEQSLVVPGFDVQQYLDCVQKVGGLEAPAAYLRVKGIA